MTICLQGFHIIKKQHYRKKYYYYCSVVVNGCSGYGKVDLEKAMNRTGAVVYSGFGVEEDVAALHSVGVLRHIHHAPALWLRSEV